MHQAYSVSAVRRCEKPMFEKRWWKCQRSAW